MSETEAQRFNRLVWASPKMSEAMASIAEAQSALATGNGWGLLVLDHAEEYLAKALACVQSLKSLGEVAVNG